MTKLMIIALSTIIFALAAYLIVVIPVVKAQTCPTIDRTNGLVSAPDGAQGFGNLQSRCVTGNQAAFSPFNITNFSDLATQFYQKATITATVNKSDLGAGNFTQANINTLLAGSPKNQLIYMHGNLTIGGPSITSTNGHVAVVFVEGELDITTDIRYAETDPSRGLVFVVSGPINIHDTVDYVDAVLISSNDNPNPIFTGIPYTICTYYDSTGVPCPMNLKTFPPLPNSKQLQVHGSFISLNAIKKINFRRDLTDNSATAAELIMGEAKYFALLKDLFCIPLSITTVDTHYSDQL